MSEMIERVAKALETRVKGHEFVSCEDAARAAIEAMREPTRGMYSAANDALVPVADAHACWSAMIAAALEGTAT